MRFRRVLLFLAITVALALGVPLAIRQVAAKSGSAQMVPDFKLTSVKGENIRLMDVVKQNNATIINFFATWCPPCRAETPDFVEYYKQFHKKGVEVIAIDIKESRSGVKKFIDTYKIPYTVLLDTDGSVSDKYGVYSIPTTIVLDPKGNAVATFQGMTTKEALESAVKGLLSVKPRASK